MEETARSKGPVLSLEFRNIGHSYGSKPALDNVSLEAKAGEVTCLLGSSGCGKTTLLRLAAGMLEVQQGSVWLNGELLAEKGRNPAPENRGIGLVFQEGALFPHLTIAENIGFGVSDANMRDEAVAYWLDQIGLSGMEKRYPSSLSGGQQQRVALARAMAPKPAILLMDEPFAAVDVVLRRSLRAECRRLLKARGAAAILVTHDPDEAMEIGDKIAVMHDRRIVQSGAPADLYDFPVNAQVGLMLGDGQIIDAHLEEGVLQTAFGAWPLSVLANDAPASVATLLVRAENFSLTPDKNGAQILEMRRVGARVQVVLQAGGGQSLTISLPQSAQIASHERYDLVPNQGSINAFA